MNAKKSSENIKKEEKTGKGGKQPWQLPTISPHKVGVLNKFGAARHHNTVPDIDGVPVAELVKLYGSPLFVLSEKTLRDNARRLRRAFMTRYPKVQFGWSYKTNYLNAVCNILHQEGSLAEVVSEFEYQKARALGVPGKYILFNGPHKQRRALEVAVAEGAHIHIDNMDELFMLEDVARNAGRVVDVSIRLNFATGYTDLWSRFGFNLEAGHAMEAARRVAASDHLKLTGLHSHIGTFILDVRAYASQVRIMCDFMDAAEAQTGCIIESLDLGGGFASPNALQGMYLPSEQVVPAPEQYAEAIINELLAATYGREARGLPRPTLILESGRSVVDTAEVLISSVVANKRLPDGRRGVVLDAGVNLLFTAFWYNHEVRSTRPLDGIPEETVLYGPLCMNIDVVRASVMLPPLGIGEPLVFSPVGAYNNTQWMQFIEYRPNVVMIAENGQVHVIREAETLTYMNQLEHLPEHLNKPFPRGVPD